MAVSELPAAGTAERAIIKKVSVDPGHSGEVEVIRALIKNILGASATDVEYENLTSANTGPDGARHKFTAVNTAASTRNPRTFVSLESAMQPVFQRTVGSGQNAVATTVFACQMAFYGTAD